VVAIKLTLYRAGGRSEIVAALLRAAGRGKEVFVFVELKARFDEERNIEWAKKLEVAGIRVVYGLVELKTHAKTALIVRREPDGIRRYVHIGTGNYNAATAAIYTDVGLLAADPDRLPANPRLTHLSREPPDRADRSGSGTRAGGPRRVDSRQAQRARRSRGHHGPVSRVAGGRGRRAGRAGRVYAASRRGGTVGANPGHQCARSVSRARPHLRVRQRRRRRVLHRLRRLAAAELTAPGRGGHAGPRRGRPQPTRRYPRRRAGRSDRLGPRSRWCLSPARAPARRGSAKLAGTSARSGRCHCVTRLRRSSRSGSAASWPRRRSGRRRAGRDRKSTRLNSSVDLGGR